MKLLTKEEVREKALITRNLSTIKVFWLPKEETPNLYQEASIEQCKRTKTIDLKQIDPYKALYERYKLLCKYNPYQIGNEHRPSSDNIVVYPDLYEEDYQRVCANLKNRCEDKMRKEFIEKRHKNVKDLYERNN